MNLGDCTVTIGNKKVHVTDVEISYDFPGDCQEVSIRGRIFDREEREKGIDAPFSTEIKGEIEITKDRFDSMMISAAYGGRNWGKTRNAYEHFFSVVPMDETLNANKNKKEKDMATYTLTEQLANDNLDEDVRLLLNENVTELDGTLTEQGKELMLNILFNEPETRAKVIDTLKKMIEKRKSEK